MIVKELISNLAILISCLFIYSQLTSDKSLRPSSSLKMKLLSGALAGGLGNILMQYSIHFQNTIIDLRHVPLILVTYYGGGIPGGVAAALIIAGRFLIGWNISALSAVIYVLLTALATLGISKINSDRRIKTFLSLTCSNVVFTVLLWLLLDESSPILLVAATFWTLSYVAGFISFRVIEYVRENQRILDKFRNEASTDSLTGLNNVREFDASFNELCTRTIEKDEHLSLLYIDIDHFKTINDTYGHKEGDQVLIELSNLLTNAVRSYDIVSRNGGEEFTVLLLDCPMDRAEEIGERIRQRVEEHSFLLTTGELLKVTVSVGLACYKETTAPPENLLKDADDALYQAKRTGRNQVCIT
ncbi:diguanylate cyclase [Salimicrobium sp. PL1-032A]|uniref:GGDEF domain-containing protein n=1 Tax=Salimicrobium sp. PL1-032A TaxID=3095364 RepID=UPI003260E2D2